MAGRKQPPFRNAFATSAQAQKDSRDRLRAGIEQRQRSPIILDPNDVSGDYDANRALLTTLGGQVRPITYADIKEFQHTIAALGKRFKGGITAKQVIDLSMPGPRARANSQIRTAFPTVNRGGRVMFQTNAGPGSTHKFHTVVVEFMNYEACVTSPVPAQKIVKELVLGKIKIDCGCEDFRYRLRYIATKGNFAAGPWFEGGYPKLTNPLLLGVGCKHILRVMQVITASAAFTGFATKMIERGRQTVLRKKQVVKVADAEKFLRAAKGERSRTRKISTSEEKRNARKAQPGYARMVEKAKQRAAEKERAKMAKGRSAALAGIERHARELLSMGAINQKQFDQMMTAAKSGG